jgi:AmiR/NasT family two-component response regulator
MSSSPLDQFSRLRMTLCCELDDQGQFLLRDLQRTRAQVRHLWPMPEKVGADTDLMLAEFKPDLGDRLSWMPGEPNAALVVLLPPGGNFDLRHLQAATPDAVLHRPYTTAAIHAAMLLAVDHFGYGRRQRTRIARLDENIRSLRNIERAKLIIMAQKRVGENEAYALLRTAAMKRGVSISALAGSLVDTNEGPR